jgi:hypothetical protein
MTKDRDKEIDIKNQHSIVVNEESSDFICPPFENNFRKSSSLQYIDESTIASDYCDDTDSINKSQVKKKTKIPTKTANKHKSKQRSNVLTSSDDDNDYNDESVSFIKQKANLNRRNVSIIRQHQKTKLAVLLDQSEEGGVSATIKNDKNNDIDELVYV